MNITVLGATGKTGQELVTQALAAGNQVTALVRTAGSLSKADNLKVVVGDVTKAEDITSASTGSQAIISALGTNKSGSTLLIDTVKAVTAASEQTGVKRFIILSSFLVETGRLQGMTKLVGRLMRNAFADKVNSEALLRQSPLDWTIVYAGRLTNAPLGEPAKLVADDQPFTMKLQTSRAGTAAWMLQEATDSHHVKQAVTIST